MKKTAYIWVILLLTCISHTSHAQQAEPDRIYFEDDFSKDTIGKFHSKWWVSTVDSMQFKNKKYLSVQKENNIYRLTTDGNPDHGVCIEPRFDSTTPLLDSSVLEFDFVLKNNNSFINIEFGKYHSKNLWGLEALFFLSYKKDEGLVLSATSQFDAYFKDKKAIAPESREATKWHHFKIILNKGDIKCYIDQYRLLYMPQTRMDPTNFAICMGGGASLAKFRLSSIKTNYEFDKILTEDKFVTHAINFDVSKSSIQPESMEFIKQLAQFLSKYPEVRLEIDGHTDSDGDAAANVTLAETRANEVKKQLTAMGISEQRLTTKGFGATKPLQPNTTPEAKANNRRVEFIKL